MSTKQEQLEKVRTRLIALLLENKILPKDLPHNVWRGNLFEQGLMDSMGATHMLELIDQEFGIEIDTDMLAGELTTVDAICKFLVDG